MKSWLILAVVVIVTGCQSVPPEPKESLPEAPISLPEPLIRVEEQKPLKAELALSDEPLVLQAWQEFRSKLVRMTPKERELLQKNLQPNDVSSLQSLLIRLHPESPYTVRFAAQTQLNDKLQTLPAGLADVLRWDLAYNQKLLENESAVTALSRLNAQQQSRLEQLNRQSKDLQKKIDALTQIEAKLNQAGN